MAPSRFTGRVPAANAGTIPSSNGRAMDAPRPLSIVRRERLFFVIIITRSLMYGRDGAASPRRDLLRRSHLEGPALHDRQNQRRPAVITGCGLPRNRAECRHVVVRDRPAEGIGQELFGERPD